MANSITAVQLEVVGSDLERAHDTLETLLLKQKTRGTQRLSNVLAAIQLAEGLLKEEFDATVEREDAEALADMSAEDMLTVK